MVISNLNIKLIEDKLSFHDVFNSQEQSIGCI
jgi:hypothetical protein